MRLLQVAAKSLKEAIRQPKGLAITVGLPLVFMLIFGFAFGQEEGNSVFSVMVANEDEGELGERFIEGLEGLEYDDGSPVLVVERVTDRDAAQRSLETRDRDALVVLPPGFTAGLTPSESPGATPLQPVERAPAEGTSIQVLGDPSFPRYNTAVAIVDAYVTQFGAEATRQPPPIVLERSAVTSTELVAFDFIAPGLMVFAILNLLPQGATMLAREMELGTIDRLRQSPAGALNILGGVALAQLAITATSLALMLVGARLMGFHNQSTWLTAFAISMLLALGVVGVSMVLASFIKTQSEAGSFGALIAVPASFLSGAFFPLPLVQLFTVGGRDFHLYQILPSTWAVEAMRQTLTFGRSLQDVAFALSAMAALSAVFLAIGVLLYRRTRLAPA